MRPARESHADDGRGGEDLAEGNPLSLLHHRNAPAGVSHRSLAGRRRQPSGPAVRENTEGERRRRCENTLACVTRTRVLERDGGICTGSVQLPLWLCCLSDMSAAFREPPPGCYIGVRRQV